MERNTNQQQNTKRCIHTTLGELCKFRKRLVALPVDSTKIFKGEILKTVQQPHTFESSAVVCLHISRISHSLQQGDEKNPDSLFILVFSLPTRSVRLWLAFLKRRFFFLKKTRLIYILHNRTWGILATRWPSTLDLLSFPIVLDPGGKPSYPENCQTVSPLLNCIGAEGWQPCAAPNEAWKAPSLPYGFLRSVPAKLWVQNRERRRAQIGPTRPGDEALNVA